MNISYIGILTKKQKNKKMRAKRNPIVIVVLVIITIIAQFATNAFILIFYGEMNLPTDNFAMVGIARKDDQNNTRNPKIFTSYHGMLIENTPGVDKKSLFTNISIDTEIKINGKPIQFGYSTIQAAEDDFFEIMDMSFHKGTLFIEEQISQAIVGFNFAKSNNISIGDKIEVSTEQFSSLNCEVVGILNHLEDKKFSLFQSSFNNSIIINLSSLLETAPELKISDIYFSAENMPDESLNVLCDTISATLCTDDIQNMIGSDETVIVQSRLSTWKTAGIWMDYIRLFQIAFTGSILLVLFLGLYNKTYIFIIDSMDEYLLLRVIGASFPQIALLVCVEMILITLKGTALGLLISLPVLSAAAIFLSVPKAIDPYFYIMLILFFIVTCILSALLVSLTHKNKILHTR